MRIAFDLDDTLIPVIQDTFPVEKPRSWWGRLLAPELIRTGAAELMRTLRRNQCELWVYTTSMRSPRHIRQIFFSYGIRLGGVVNYQKHWQWLVSQTSFPHCSKYPPAFGIDLLIDDSEGVRMEGEQFHFSVLHLHPATEDWVSVVLERINQSFDPPIVLPNQV